MFHANQSRRSGVQSSSPLRLRTRAAGALLAAAVVTACATPQEVSYTRQVAKGYENQVFDLERQLEEKNAELAQLNDRFARERQSNLVNASTDPTINQRIEDLGRLIDEMDGPIRDVERFDLEGGYLLMIQDRILFDSGSADLGPEGSDALQSIASEIAATSHGDILVRGHTDSDPVKKPATIERFPNGNLQLSAERAVSVAAFLIQNSQISGNDVVVMGFGSHKPVRPNDTAESKRLNRRVEIFVSDPEN